LRTDLFFLSLFAAENPALTVIGEISLIAGAPEMRASQKLAPGRSGVLHRIRWRGSGFGFARTTDDQTLWIKRNGPVAGSVLLIPLVGYFDRLVGVDVSLAPLYLVPVAITAWHSGRLATICVALGCATVWFTTHASLLHVYDHPAILFWNSTVRLAVFSIVGLLLVSLRHHRDSLELAVEEKTKLLKQEIAERKKNEHEFFGLVQRHREAVAFELHDSLAQFLTGIAVKAKTIERQLALEFSPRREAMEEIVKLLNQAIGETREIARGLGLLDGCASDIVAALHQLAIETTNKYRIKCQSRSTHLQLRCSEDASVHLYRLAQQAIVNAVQHAQPQSIDLRLSQTDREFKLTIDDDGVGFNPAAVSGDGLGLRIMTLRAKILGGRLEIRSTPGTGTCVEMIADLSSLLATEPEGERAVPRAA